MNSFEILQAMTDIPNEPILSARDCLGYHREEGPMPKHSPKRIWLIAAVVALLLLLMGCTVAYVLSLQDMEVGEYSFYVPPAYDEDGNPIPAPTPKPITQLSLQGANKDALAEWLAFTNAYDPELEIAAQADQAAKAGNPWDIPDNYHYVYGCYSQEMVDKLNEIVKKYDLKLLSTDILCQHYESSVILGSLGLDSLFSPGQAVDAEYYGGYFFPEGTFDINMYMNLDTGDWKLENNLVSCRYSVKEFFDPVCGAIGEIDDYTQWNYTRKDGLTVLLVLNKDTARIYADLPDAFVSIYVDPEIWVNGEKAPMTAPVLEQIAELFDLSIKPGPVDMEQVEQLQAAALADHEAEKADALKNHEEKFNAGYQEFVNYRLETTYNPESLSYIMYDVNSDGTDELIIQYCDILSMKDGTSYKYFDITEVKIAGATFYPCEGDTFELCHELFAMHQYYYYQAEAESVSFITGVIHDTNEDIWYRSLNGGSYDENVEQITAEEAQQIRDSFTRIDVDFLPLVRYGQEVTSIYLTDPYARYIADKMERYADAENYQYALLDVNGDGIEELITRDSIMHTNGETYLTLSIHTIRNGELWDMGIYDFAYVCEGGILEKSDDFVGREDGSLYHAFYRYTDNGFEMIEKVVRNPISLHWGHALLAGPDRKTVTEEKAKSILNSYKRMELDWKPFSEYPLS